MIDENGVLTARQWHKAFFAAPLTSRTQQAYSLACWTCNWDKLPYQNLKPRRTAISLTILILLHVAPCYDGKGYFHNLNTGTSASYVCLELPSLSGCCFDSCFPLYCSEILEVPNLQMVVWKLCHSSFALNHQHHMHVISSYFWNCEEELQEGHGVTTHLLTALCVGPSSDIPSDTANIFSNQECPIDTHSDNWGCSTMHR